MIKTFKLRYNFEVGYNFCVHASYFTMSLNRIYRGGDCTLDFNFYHDFAFLLETGVDVTSYSASTIDISLYQSQNNAGNAIVLKSDAKVSFLKAAQRRYHILFFACCMKCANAICLKSVNEFLKKY